MEKKEKKFVLDLGNGEEVDLKDILRESTMDSLKEFGFPMDEGGKFSLKSLPVEVKDEASKKLDAMEKSANFIKHIAIPEKLHKQYGIKSIDTTTGSMGYTVPTELSSEILLKKQKYTIMRKHAFVFELAGKYQLPTEGTGVTGYWVSENSPITESSPTTGQSSLDDYYLAALVKAPWKLLNTSAANIVNFISTLSAKALTETEETAFVAGDGSGKPTGLRQASLTSVGQAGASFAYSDILGLYFKLKKAYRQNAMFLTSAKGAQLLTSLADSQGRPLFPPGQTLEQLFAKPLEESEDIPANLGTGTNETEVYFGDPFYYWIKDGQAMEMASQDVIENLQTKIVLYQAVDGKLVLPEAFVKLTGVK